MARWAHGEMDLDGLDAALSSSGVRAELERLASAAASRARASAPVQSGAYQANIGSEVDDSGPRPKGIVYATAPHAFAVEAATGNLARSVRG